MHELTRPESPQQTSLEVKELAALIKVWPVRQSRCHPVAYI